VVVGRPAASDLLVRGDPFELFDELPGVGGHGDVDGVLARELLGVDVDLGERGVVDQRPVVRRERREAGADGDDAVCRPDRLVCGVGPAVADDPQAQVVVLREDTTTRQRGGDRDVETFDERAQRRPRPAPDDPAAGEHQRGVGGREQVEDGTDPVVVGPGAVEGKPEFVGVVERPLPGRVGGLLPGDVLGEVDVDRARATGDTLDQRLAGDPGRVIAALDAGVPLRKALENAHHVPLVPDVTPEARAILVARDGNDWRGVPVGGGHPHDLVGGPGPDMSECHPRSARHPGVPVSHRRGDLFVSRRDEREIQVDQLVDGVHHDRPGEPENVLDARVRERPHEDFRGIHVCIDADPGCYRYASANGRHWNSTVGANGGVSTRMFIQQRTYLISMVCDSNTRRKFLKGAGTASIALVAGCSGGDGGGGGGGGSDGGGDGGDGGGDGGGDDGDGGDTGGGDDFPNQPITFKVIADTGGGYDFYTRLVAKHIRENDLLPVDIKVENLTMSLIGRFNNIYKSEADGYTYGTVWPGFARMQAQGLDPVEYDIAKITPMPSAGPNLRAFSVAPDLDVNNTAELIDLIKNGDPSFYTTGVRSTGTIAPVLFGELGGVYDLERVMNNFVVYDGVAQGMTGMARGEVNIRVSSLSSSTPAIEADDMRPILILTTGEIPALYGDDLTGVETLPDIQGVDNKEQVESLTSFNNYWNFCGPPDIPEERANVVRDAMKEVLQSDALQEEAREQARTVSFTDSESVGKDLTQKVELWGEFLPLLDEMEEAASR